LLREGQSSSDARHNAQESYLQNLGMTLGNAVRHMQSNGAGLNSILHNLSQTRGGTLVDTPASSTSGPPPLPPAAGAIAIGGSSSSSVAAQLAGETARPRRTKERAGSRSPRGRKPAVPAPDIPAPPSLPPPLAIAACSHHSAETSTEGEEDGLRANRKRQAAPERASGVPRGIHARPRAANAATATAAA